MSLSNAKQMAKENDFEILEDQIIELEDKWGEKVVLEYLKEMVKHLKEEVKNRK